MPIPEPVASSSWRDPAMPVFLRGHYFTPAEITAAAKHNMTKSRMSGRPSWRKDPTYNLRRSRRQ